LVINNFFELKEFLLGQLGFSRKKRRELSRRIVEKVFDQAVEVLIPGVSRSFRSSQSFYSASWSTAWKSSWSLAWDLGSIPINPS
jgi:hypothetical protein